MTAESPKTSGGEVVKDSSAGGSGANGWLLTLAACLKVVAGGARPTGSGGAPSCADTRPPCHPASETPVALAAVVGELLDAFWGGSNPLPRGGTNPAVEVVDVEGALPVPGGGVNPCPRGDSNPSPGGSSNPLPGSGAHPPVEVLSGVGEVVAVPAGGGVEGVVVAEGVLEDLEELAEAVLAAALA